MKKGIVLAIAVLAIFLINYSAAECTEIWDCSSWGNCIQGIQIRTCTDLNNCMTNLQRPFETRTCSMPAAPMPSKFNLDNMLLILLIILPVFIIAIALIIFLRYKNQNIENLIKRAKRAVKSKRLYESHWLYKKIHLSYMKLHSEDKKKYHWQIKEIYEGIKTLEKRRLRAKSVN